MKQLSYVILIVALVFVCSVAIAGPVKEASTPCQSMTPACVGGPAAKGDSLLTIRWLGTENYELTYRNQVILMNAYLDRGPRNKPIGVMPADVSRADVIFLGHGHFDHMSDAAEIALKTGAIVVAGDEKATIQKLKDQGVPSNQIVPVVTGSVLRFNGFTVEAILAQHSTLSPAILGPFQTAIKAVIGDPTPEEAAAEAIIRSKGASSPNEIIMKGTYTFLFTFDSGFRLIFRDSAGPITVGEVELMERIGSTDLAMVAYVGQYLAEAQVPVTLDLIQLYNPRFYIPGHHDAIAGIFIDIGVEPLYEAMAEVLPNTKGYFPLYRRPICFNVSSKAPTD